MNRVDRLFAITLLLQARRKIRARDLAEKFEINKRTIYRDMAALSESGVPIVSTPGEGYELIEGYYLPPLLFTPSEAAALFLSAHFLIANATGRVPKDAQAGLIVHGNWPYHESAICGSVALTERVAHIRQVLQQEVC